MPPRILVIRQFDDLLRRIHVLQSITTLTKTGTIYRLFSHSTTPPSSRRSPVKLHNCAYLQTTN